MEMESGQTVRANIHEQHLHHEEQSLLRISTLHIGQSLPLLTAKCILDVENLKELEIFALTHSDTPIGTILLQSSSDALRRQNIVVTRHQTHELSNYLQSDSVTLYSKSFELWHGTRRIGHLVELVSETSLDIISRAQPATLAKST